jgi:hypothetical protein
MDSREDNCRTNLSKEGANLHAGFSQAHVDGGPSRGQAHCPSGNIDFYGPELTGSEALVSGKMEGTDGGCIVPRGPTTPRAH